jgi:hypothetical protein|tara:strand:+ start:225 stop:488 length:264 start_codon:yes stop_codon:yes gene_type:complete
MALLEKTIVDKIEIVGDFKHIQVREDNQIVDDDTGDIKSRGNYHRYVLAPDADISGQPSDVQAVANAAWTDEIKAAFTEYKNSASSP